MSQASKHKQPQQPALTQWRFWLVVGVILMVFSGLIARAAYIQVIAPDHLIEQGDNRTLRHRDMPVHRGLITDRNGEQLAVSVPVRAIWSDPKHVHDQNGLEDQRRWQALADVLGQDVDALKAKVSNPERRFVYLQRQVSPAMASYVEQLKLPGVYLRNESRRFYPGGEVSAHLVGFTNVDDVGIEGIEKLYNDWLTGTPGKRVIRKDAKGRQVEVLDETAAEKPQDLQLTIDQRIQTLAYRALKQGVADYEASSGSVVVADIHTGDVLAMVNSPSFNPNNRRGVMPRRMRNRAITDAFEPGSVAKPLAVLAALEFGAAQPDDVIDTAPGYMRVGGSMVQDIRNYGELDLTGIIQKSSNIGTSKLALSVPKTFLLDTYYNMGLMSDTGINLIGESTGIFHERNRWSDFELSTMSFGYNFAVTTLQIARMYSVLGNGGIKRPMNIIQGGSEAFREEGERVISEENARHLLRMMESVTEDEGSGKLARVSGYRIAGKTGTSRKAVAGGYGQEYVNIFAGVAPVSDPQIVVVVLINEPRGDLYHAGDTAAPVFSKVMTSTLQLLNVPPDARPVNQLVNSSRRND